MPVQQHARVESLTSAEGSFIGAPPASPKVLGQIGCLLDALAASGVEYCHWKSNYALAGALQGQGDLDILVRGADFGRFAAVALECDFKLAQSISSALQAGVFHFLGFDEHSGQVINVHAYSQLRTGDHFLKTYALPLESMLLEDRHEVAGMPIPAPGAELVIFAVRDLLKHTTVIDLLLRHRLRREVAIELQWLDAEQTRDEAIALLARHLPEIPEAEFRQALDCIGKPAAWLERQRLAWRWRARLGRYRRLGEPARIALTTWVALRMQWNRRVIGCKHMRLCGGGLVVALVGPPATGKSTIAANLQSWLGTELEVRRIHVGKPPSTLLTCLPNWLMPLSRRLAPKLRSGQVEASANEVDGGAAQFRFPWVFLVRRLMVAYDRRALLRRAVRWSRNGAVVLCDRYPSDRIGAVDGASFDDETIARQTSSWKRRLMRLERRLYADVVPADIVLQLRVPVREAVSRNEERVRHDPKDARYVEWRHASTLIPVFPRSRVVGISTDGALEDALARARAEVWSALV